MKLHVVFTNDIELVYDIVEEEITNFWAKEINQLFVEDLCEHNHYIGNMSDDSIVHEKIHRLYEINDILNERLPNASITELLTKENWNKLLHKMHVNFVELADDKNHIDIWPQLSEYNDVIHWLESILIMWWDEKSKERRDKVFRIILDFNKNEKTVFRAVPDSAYKLFDPFIEFGKIYLHYTRIGKNPYGIFLDRDYVFPKEQLAIQDTFTASIRLEFSENYFDNQASKIRFLYEWKKFYIAKGGKEFWGYDFDDPKLGFGYMKIGDLSEIKIKNKVIDIPKLLEERIEFRKLIAETKILNWSIE